MGIFKNTKGEHIVAAIMIIASIFLALEDISGWGWFLFLGFILAYDF